jgi:hypothetical protein
MRNKYRGKERDVFELDVGIGPIVHRYAINQNAAMSIEKYSPSNSRSVGRLQS